MCHLGATRIMLCMKENAILRNHLIKSERDFKFDAALHAVFTKYGDVLVLFIRFGEMHGEMHG